MSSFLQFAASMREQMHATLSRSDVLKALVWPIGILLTAIVSLSYGNTPQWLLYVLTGLLVLFTILYIGAYLYCLINNPDSLRSEKYSLHKMAIERGVFGDDKMGIIDSEPAKAERMLTISDSPVQPESGR